ncbi:MAG TPA: DUF4286 family protein [Holophagaceae bacterium]|nr:DUF4286 family protein [Holophagaceae bacterium]
MTTYEVQVETPADAAEAFEAYMRRKHIPEILATGCFTDIAFERASPTKFRTRYQARAKADLDRYLLDHAPAFRLDFLKHFPEGCAVQRELWESVQDFR